MQKNIVILGAGFGGLKTAFVLAKKIRSLGLMKKYDLILIDRNDYHTYTPTLYEIATTSKEIAEYHDLKRIVTFPLEKILKNSPVKFKKLEVQGLDLKKRQIIFKNKEILAFEYLIVALGAETNYYGIPGMTEHSLSLKTFRDATLLRDQILEAASLKSKIEVVIGGGGSTGVEIAGEIREWLCGKEEPKCVAGVTLIESSPSILNGFKPRIVSSAKKRLEFLDVNVFTESAIEKLSEKTVELKNGRRLPYDIFIWAGGIKAPEILKNFSLATEAKGRLEVKDELDCVIKNQDLSLAQKIYAIGDNICFIDQKTQKQTPAVARAALIQAAIVAHNIAENIEVEEKKKFMPVFLKYSPKPYPYIIPIGGKWAVAEIGPVIVTGFPAWVLKGLVELGYLLSIMPPLLSLKIWFKGLKIFIRNDRLG